MIKTGFSLLLFSTLLFSCTQPAENSDQPKSDSSRDTAKARHGLTVTDPIDRQPHMVKDSIYNGTHIDRYDNGVIFMRGEVEGGVRVGEWLTFYRSGKPWSKGTYVKGLRQGYGVAWYENGNKAQEGYYKDDKMVGPWKFWDEYGNMKEHDFGGGAPDSQK